MMQNKGMLRKVLRASYWDGNGGTASRLIGAGSKGLDRDHLQKIGASEEILAADVSPQKGHAFLHVVTTGAGEYFSCNGNGDYYNEGPLLVTFPFPMAEKTAQLNHGLLEYHSTYRKFGGVYRNHLNSTKGGISEGEIIAEGYNRPKHWGELLIKVAEDPWTDVLQKAASGQPVFWSVGAGVPSDICGLCGFRYSKGMSSRCQHTDKRNILTLYKEGHQSFLYNDEPHFHDISNVTFPADRIAFLLQKVATGNLCVDDVAELESNHQLLLPCSLFDKDRLESRRQWLRKLAKEEKEQSKEDLSDVEDGLKAVPEDEDKVVRELAGVPLEGLLSALCSSNMMLTPRMFVRIVTDKPGSECVFPGFDKALNNVFTEMQGRPDVENFLADRSYSPDRGSPGIFDEHKVQRLSPLLSLSPEPLRMRIVRITVKGEKPDKVQVEKEAGADEPSSSALYMAREYARYQLAFVEKQASMWNVRLAVLMNRIGV